MNEHMMMLNHDELAQQIFIRSIDLQQPMFFRETAKQAIHAAEVFFSTLNEGKPVEPTEEEKMIAIAKKGGNNKIAAIKEIRSATGLGLKEAKDWIDKLVAENKLVYTPQSW